jgi:hypothetical protein
MNDSKPEELPAIDDGEDLAEHPEEVTEQEAALGKATYLMIDDLDDESNGLDQ